MGVLQSLQCRALMSLCLAVPTASCMTAITGALQPCIRMNLYLLTVSIWLAKRKNVERLRNTCPPMSDSRLQPSSCIAIHGRTSPLSHATSPLPYAARSQQTCKPLLHAIQSMQDTCIVQLDGCAC